MPKGNNNLYAITPLSGPADGKGGINWIEVNSAINNPDLHPKAIFDFLAWITKPEAAYIVARGNGNLQPVSQMAQPEVMAKFTKEQLDAMQWDDVRRAHRQRGRVRHRAAIRPALDIYTAACGPAAEVAANEPPPTLSLRGLGRSSAAGLRSTPSPRHSRSASSSPSSARPAPARATLIRMLAGLETPTRGDILLRGRRHQRRAGQPAADLHGVPVPGAVRLR